MNITTKYVLNLITDAGNTSISYNQLTSTLLTLKSTVKGFGSILRRLEEHGGKRIPVYTISTAQAIMLITALQDNSIVFLVRDLIRLENNHEIPLHERTTEIESVEMIDKATQSGYSEIGMVLSVQSASMDMVDVTKNALLSLTSDNKHRGVCTIRELKEMLSEVTGENITIPYVLSLIIKHASNYKTRIMRAKPNKIFIPLDWLSNYLDPIMQDIINKVPANSQQASEVDKYIGVSS